MVGVEVGAGGVVFNPPAATGELVLEKSCTDIAAEAAHLPAVQRAFIAARVKTRGAGGNTRSARAQEHKLLIPANPYPTLREVAKLFDVAVSTIQRCRAVLEKGSPELIEAVREGLVQPYLAGRLVDNTSHERQAEFVAAVRRGHSPKTLGTQMFGEDPYSAARRERYVPGTSSSARQKKPAPAGRYLTVAEVAQVRHTLDALGHMVRASDGLDPSITNEQAAQLLDGLSKGRGALRRVVQLLTQRRESTQP